MGNSTNSIPRKKRTSSLHCIGQTVPHLNAAARRAIATTTRIIAAANTICDRALMQWEVSHP